MCIISSFAINRQLRRIDHNGAHKRHILKNESFLRTSCAFSVLVQFLVHNSCLVASFKLPTLDVRHPSHIHSLLDCYSTRHSRSLMLLQLRTALSKRYVCFTPLFQCAALYFCSCELRWPNTECVLLPCFIALPDIFAVMNCSALALSAVFCSGLLTWSADNYVHYNDTLYNNEEGECV